MNILFVCSGNTCRSPMAEFILKDKLNKLNVKNVNILSAGIYAEDGCEISSLAKQALWMYQIDCEDFRSKKITTDMIRESDLVVCMTGEQKNAIQGLSNNVYTIKEYTGIDEITDPFSDDLSSYLKTASLLDDACEIIKNKIKHIGEKI